jgi:hypothetical protein
MVCRWGEYREGMCRAMERVVMVVLNEMRDQVEESTLAVEQHLPVISNPFFI